MTEHEVATREEWLAARREPLEMERAHAQPSEECAEPKGKVDEFRSFRREEYPAP